MVVIIDGKSIASSMLEWVKEHINLLQHVPCLAAVVVGDNPASDVYVSHKERACARVGMDSRRVVLPNNATEDEVLRAIDKLNGEPNIDGIIVQLPLPAHINSVRIASSIDPRKDVDCLHPSNVGKLWLGTADLTPCTPTGIMALLDHEGIAIEGCHAVVIGRSAIVGKPISALLLARSATVTICHSRTRNLAQITSQADILIAAAGVPGLITGEMIKDGAVVIDVGITRDDKKLKGDVDFQSVFSKASYITPTPGGVGPMTVAMLIKNTYLASRKRRSLE